MPQHNCLRVRLLAAAVGAALIVALPASARADIKTQRVQFAKGATSAIITGSIQGDQIVDYLVGARQGQSANISMATRHGATYFNIMAPGETAAAFFIGSRSENQYEGALPASGDYRIRVYMMRSAARRNESADYRLEIVIAAAPQPAAAAPGDAKVAGTDYHATGSLICAMGGGKPTGSCAFGVKREGPGNAMVTVTKPDGATHTIFFDGGRATGYDASQADRATFRASRQGDLTTVHIGDERYEIPDAVVNGG